MTLRMGDGPPANLPADLDGLAGYVDESGIGVTWPEVSAMPARFHMSISVHGHPAHCGDVESGALATWKGYVVGYCAISNLNRAVTQGGRPPRVWVAHYDPGLGPHICSSAIGGCVAAAGGRMLTEPDGCQWVDHGPWDESLLSDRFFDFLALPSPHGGSGPGGKVGNMLAFDPVTGGTWGLRPDGAVYADGGAPYLGGLNAHPEWQAGGSLANGPAVGIAPFGPGGAGGYEILCDNGTAAQPARYRFPRDGSLAR